jgi:hypothetical protein
MRLHIIGVLLVASTASAEQARKVKDQPPPKKKKLVQPAISPQHAARLPDGRLVSYKAGDELVIARITKKGPVEAFRKQIDGTDFWIDAKTLAVVNADIDGGVVVDFIVDGVLDARRHLVHKKEAWALKKGEEALSHQVYRADKELWVEACLEEDLGREHCKKVTWLRVDVTPARPSRSKPPRTISVYSQGPQPPDIKAPAGASVKFAKVKGESGVECVAPGTKGAWSITNEGGGGSFAPTKVHWVHGSPLIFGVEGVETNPVGWDSNVTKYYRACAEAELENFAWLGDGVWTSEDRNTDVITMRVDDTTVAMFEGARLEVAPK